MRPLSRQRQGSQTVRYQTPQRLRFSKEHYLLRKPFELSVSLIQEPVKKYLKPTIRISQLSQRMSKFKYLPLHYFEDTLFDKFSNLELLHKIQQNGPLKAQILVENNHYEFVDGIITDYQNEEFQFQAGEHSGMVKRLYFVCDLEDSKKYIQKFEKALQDRESMDNYLRYNYYIDNMQTNDIPELPTESLQRILALVKGNGTAITSQIIAHYKRVQNQLTFDAYLRNNKDILSWQLQKKETYCEFGKMQLNFKEMMIVHKDFVDIQPTSFVTVRRQFQEVSLFTLPELIKGFYRINELNKQITSLELLYWDKLPYSILLLKEKQDSLTNKQMKQISKWSETTKEIMLTCLSELKSRNIEIPNERLKRIIRVIRIKQQDALHKLVKDNIALYKSRLSSSQLVYYISVGYFGDFSYCYDVSEIVGVIQHSLEIQLQELSKIRDPECIMGISDLMYLECKEEESVNRFLAHLSQEVDQMNKLLIEHLRAYFKYRYIFEWQLNDFVRDCTINDKFDLHLFQKQIEKLCQLQLQLTKELQLTDQVSVFSVHNSHLLFQINQLLEQNVRQMIEYVVEQANTAVKNTILEFQKLQLQIKRQSNDILGLEQQRIFLTQDVHQCLDQLQMSINESLKIYEVLDDLSYIATHEQMKERWNLLSFIHILELSIATSLEELMEKRIQQKYDFQQDLLHFKYSIDDVERKVNHFIRHYSATSNQSFMGELLELKEQAKLMNQYEVIFNLPCTNFGKIDFIIQSLQPLESLSVLLAQWNQSTWMQTPIECLEAQKIQDFVEQSLQQLASVLQYATEKKMVSIQFLSQQMLNEIQAFQPHLPIIFALTEPGMRDRHWNQLNQKVGQQIPKSQVNFQELLSILDEIDIQRSVNCRTHLLEISYIAQQELIIEKTFNQLNQEYKCMSGQVLKARIQNVQYNKVFNLQNLFQKLDDCLCTLSVVLQSKFHEPWKKELHELESAMIYSQTLVSEMEQMQLLMSYIHPVFQQSDLQKQLPIEVSRFKAVEKFWKAVTSEFQLVHKFKNDGIHEQIIKLQTIEKSLNNYIDKKREIFQRFHFLSNQQILMIQSRQPNEFINQLFAFDTVILDEDGIISLKIGDKEHLDIQRVNIYTKCVEDWLHELITAMRKALKQQILKNQHCKQIKRIIQQIEWTYALDNGFKDFNMQQASHQDLQKFKYLSTIDTDSFEYAMQLRYYLNEEQTIVIRILQYSFEYDYEFQRSDESFIHTPQTDRCYAHLAFAIGNHFGAYIYGNSGKIETIKGFSNAIGKYFIVMNANLSNYQVLTHLCKGVSATGTYLTLTKCSEMRPELLSIFVQLVKCVYFAIRNQLQLIEFEGQTVKIIPTFAFFLIGDHINKATEELRHFFRVIYLPKVDINIVLEYLGHEYGITSLIQIKQFVHLYTSLKQDLSTIKLRQLFSSAKTEGIHKSLIKQFPDLQENINQLFDSSEIYKIELQELLQESRYILIYGPSLSGKSQLISKIEKIRKIYISSFNYESYFGTFDTEGTLSEMLNHQGTLVFDGEIDERMMEMLIQLVLFQQMRFPNGKVLQINNNIIFETSSIDNLSPNTVTRLALLYQAQVQIEIPAYAQMFVCLADIYKSPITKDQQVQQFKQILTRIKGTSTTEFEAVYAATWAFGSALNGERKLLMNRHIKEIWNNLPTKTVDPLTFGNLFDYAIIDSQLVDVGVDNLNRLLRCTEHIILFGESGSGKSTFLKNPLNLDMCSTSIDLLNFIQGRSIKKRNQTYSVGRVDIDDLHLPINKNCNELLRQFVDDQGCHKIRFTDLQIVATSSILKQQNLLRYFLPYYCETPSYDQLFARIQQQGVLDLPILKDIYRQAVEFFKGSRHLKITHYDLYRCLSYSNPCQSLLQSIYFKTDDENLKLSFITSQKLFKTEPMSNDYSELFEKQGLVQFEANTMLLNYLIKCNSGQVIIYGPFGMGKKTLAKLACQVSQREFLLLDEPKLEQLSQVVNKQVIVTMTTQKLLNYSARSTLVYKFQLIHHGQWPEEVFSDICGYQIYQHAKFTQIYPKLYIDYTLLQNRLFQERSNSVQKRISQLSQGLQLLYSAQQAVNQMNSKLTLLQPVLESAVRETQEIVGVLKLHTLTAQAAREQILQDEQLAAEEQKKATQLSEMCKARVQEVNQLLDETLQEMQRLKKDHLVEIKSLLQPPKAVRVVLGGVVILLSEVFRIPLQDDYFEAGKKHLLNDVKELLEVLKNYQKDTIPQALIQQLESRIISDPEFTLERAKQCSLAVKYLYSWVRAMYDYHKVFTETKPLREQLQAYSKELQLKNQDLENKRKELHEINEKLESYEMQVKEKQKIKEQLQNQIEQCQTKISRSVKLIEGFKEEQKRWTTLIYHKKGEETRNEGDSIIAASLITYGGPFTREERNSFYQYLWKLLSENEIKFTESCTLNTYFQLNEDLQIEENACILKYRKRPALLVDSQDLGRKYLKSQNYLIFKEQRKIQQCLQLKQVFCVEISEEQHLIFDMNVINIARKALDPQNRYQVINYTITQDALVEKVLKCFIELENPSLELKKEHNLQLIAKDKVQLNSIEEQILHILQSRSIDELLGDETLINELRNSKITYEETSKRIDMSKRLSEEIDVSRDQYRILAQQLSRIYFVILELPNLNNLYHYSLDWFLNQLVRYCGKIDRQTQVALNIQLMKQSFFKGIINEVGQFLTEEHRLIFCFKISLDILLQRGLITEHEINSFITRVPQKQSSNPCIFIDDSEWPAIKERLAQLDKLPAFAGILEDIEDHPNAYKQLYLHQIFTTEQQKLTQFQKLLLTNAFRPDKVVSLMINLIEQVLQLKYMFTKGETNERIQLLLNDSKFYSKLSLTLGEGQHEKAEKVLKEAIEFGSTVELRNCQFGSVFLNQAESLFEEDSKIHPNFKLILQLQQCQDFPINWLYKSTKIASQKPHTLIDLLIQQIENLAQIEHPRYFSLNLFHAIMNLRYLYGYWPYWFHETDLRLILDKQPYLKELVYQSQFPEEDAELMNALYMKCVCQQSLREGFIYMGGELKLIKADRDGYLQYLRDMGSVNDFNCIGLNSNSQIIIQNETMQRIQKGLTKVNQSSLDLLEQLEKLERYTPLKLSDIVEGNILDIYYAQEQKNFNKLIECMNEDVKAIQQYLRGGMLESHLIMDFLQKGEVPPEWINYSKVSEKKLNIWLNRVFEKGQFLSKWSSQKTFNLSYLSNPKLFLDLIKLQQSKQLQCEVEFKQSFLREHHLEITERPSEGVYISGLRVRGAKYNEITQKMKPLGHLEFYSDLPVLHLRCAIRQQEDKNYFMCPVIHDNQVIMEVKFETQETLIQLGVKIII